jgi:hypothetical protein
MSNDTSAALAYPAARAARRPALDLREWLPTRLLRRRRPAERWLHDAELRSQLIDARSEAAWRAGFRGF